MRKSVIRSGDLIKLPENKTGLAVIGYPIEHSISPYLHHAALRQLSESKTIFSDWEYHKIEARVDELKTLLPRLAELGYRGINLTIPHKVEVLSLLDEIDPEAESMGAVNTLSWQDNKWIGSNTDGYGFRRAVEASFGRPLKEYCILVLGAGGAARAAAMKCLFVGCEEIWLTNRSQERLGALVSDLRKHEPDRVIGSFSPENLPEILLNKKNLLIVNSTSLGLKTGDPSPLLNSFSVFDHRSKVYDMIYNPPETTFLQEAKEANLEFAGGLSMLVYQALQSLHLWTGEDICEEAMFAGANHGMLEINS